MQPRPMQPAMATSRLTQPGMAPSYLVQPGMTPPYPTQPAMAPSYPTQPAMAPPYPTQPVMAPSPPMRAVTTMGTVSYIPADEGAQNQTGLTDRSNHSPSRHSMSSAGHASSVAEDTRHKAFETLVENFKASSAGFGPPRQSIYGVCMVTPQVAGELGWHPFFVGKVVQAFLVLILCFVMQSAFIYEIYNIARRHDLGCEEDEAQCEAAGYKRSSLIFASYLKWHLCEENPGLDGKLPYITRYLCVTVFSLALSNDLRETLELAWCIFLVPREKGTWLTAVFNPEVGVTKDGQEHMWEYAALCFKVSGMTRRWKVLNMFFLVLPKLVIFLGLLVVGCIYLLNEKDRAELILNAVALVFVVDIHKVFFVACTTRDIREKMEGLKPWYKNSMWTDTLSEGEDEDDEDEPARVPSFRSEETSDRQALLRGITASLGPTFETMSELSQRTIDETFSAANYVWNTLYAFLQPAALTALVMAWGLYYEQVCSAES